jgi:hypothetical protein
MREEAEAVHANWIAAALSPVGQLPPDVPPAQWVAEKFLRWWRGDAEERVGELIGDAESALAGVRSELMRLGGWSQFGEALHECIHLGDALGDLRATLFPQRQGP